MHRSMPHVAAAAIAVAQLAAGAPAAADESRDDALDLDLAKVPVVAVTPDVAFVRAPKSEWGTGWAPAAAELEAPVVDFGRSPRARMVEPRRAGNLSVVRTNALDYPGVHEAQGWLRFFQSDASAIPFTFNCGRGDALDRSIESFTLAPQPDGTARFLYRHAWVDLSTCRGRMLRSWDVGAVPVAGGLAFAYRTSCERCAPGKKEQLHLVTGTPRSVTLRGGSSRFTYFTWVTEAVEISIEEGVSASYAGTFDAAAVVELNRALTHAATPPPVTGTTTLRVEIVRALGDPLPVANVFVR